MCWTPVWAAARPGALKRGQGGAVACRRSAATRSLRALLEAGAAVGPISTDGYTPASLAASNQHTDCLVALKEFGGPIELQNEAGEALPVVARKAAEAETKKEEEEEAKPAEPLTAEQEAEAASLKAEGNKAFGTKDYPTAIDAYTKALALTPTPELLSNRSVCYLSSGSPDEALDDARRAKALRPSWPKPFFREGKALMVLKRFQEAAEAFWDGFKLDDANFEMKK